MNQAEMREKRTELARKFIGDMKPLLRADLEFQIDERAIWPPHVAHREVVAGIGFVMSDLKQELQTAAVDVWLELKEERGWE